MMIESARITKGDIKPIQQLKASDFDALFIPGGLGSAKNFSDLAYKRF